MERLKIHPGIKKSIIIILAILLALMGLRIYLPFWVTGFVNDVLADIPGYQGSIKGVDINLYRGAYKIRVKN